MVCKGVAEIMDSSFSDVDISSLVDSDISSYTESSVAPPFDSSLSSPMQKDFAEYSLSELLLLLIAFFALIAFIVRFFKD